MQQIRPAIELRATAGYFDQELWDVAREDLLPHFRVGGGITNQLEEFPPPQVVVEFVLAVFGGISLNLIAAVLYDALKAHFIRPKNSRVPTRFQLNVIDEPRRGMPDARSVYCSVQTDDPEILREAMATFREAVLGRQERGQMTFDVTTHQWVVGEEV